MSKKKYTAADLVERIRYRYSEKQRYVVMEQVAMGTGGYARSWIDAAVFNLWPSDGCSRAAFEVKTVRSDFLHELQNPEKNQWARDSFHEFWFVAPADAIKEEELPEGCGWMKPHGKGLTIVRHASHREEPKLDDVLLAAFVRASTKAADTDSIRERERILASSPQYKTAKEWQDAAITFLKSRGDIAVGPGAARRALRALNDATQGNHHKELQERVAAILEDFEEKMFGLVEIMEVIARVGINAKTDADEYIMEAYGSQDKTTIAKVRREIKDHRHSYSNERFKERLQWLLAFVEEKP